VGAALAGALRLPLPPPSSHWPPFPPRPLLGTPRSALTENTRASYPIAYIDNARIPCVGPHPRNVVLLCCDAFGVLPPVSRLTLEQAMYHFISGYTSKARADFCGGFWISKVADGMNWGAWAVFGGRRCLI
jgi:hypothetical protein